MDLLRGFLMLLGFQVAGTLLQAGLRLPLPGPVIGMALLAGWLLAKPKQVAGPVGTVADGLLRWLGLLFVPAGVGVFANMALLRTAWVATCVALVGSTMLTFVAAALVMQALGRRRRVSAP